MKSIECVGKDIEEALNKGLAELDCRLDDVNVEIVEHPGIFRKAKVRLTFEGGKGKSPAASEIMRDLEKRAKEVRADQRDDRRRRDDRKGGKRPESGADGRARGQEGAPAQQGRANNAPAQQGRQNAPAQGKPNNAPAQQNNQQSRQNVPSQGKPNNAPAQQGKANTPPAQQVKRENASAQVSQAAKDAPKGENKSAFRTDFRAQLEAAESGKTAEPAAIRQGDQNKRREGAQQQKRQDAPKGGQNAERRDRPKPVREVSEELVASVKEYLEKAVSLMGIPAEAVCSASDGEINAELKTEDALAIGRKGETLDALEYLATLTTADGDKYVHVNLDCGEYRARRNEAIRTEALAAADKAVSTGRRVELEPMNSASRREVHAVLGERGDVITRSEGREPDRRVVIIPKGFRNGDNGGRKNNNRNRHRRPGGKGEGRPRQQNPDGQKSE